MKKQLLISLVVVLALLVCVQALMADVNEPNVPNEPNKPAEVKQKLNEPLGQQRSVEQKRKVDGRKGRRGGYDLIAAFEKAYEQKDWDKIGKLIQKAKKMKQQRQQDHKGRGGEQFGRRGQSRRGGPQSHGRDRMQGQGRGQGPGRQAAGQMGRGPGSGGRRERFGTGKQQGCCCGKCEVEPRKRQKSGWDW